MDEMHEHDEEHEPGEDDLVGKDSHETDEPPFGVGDEDEEESDASIEDEMKAHGGFNDDAEEEF